MPRGNDWWTNSWPSLGGRSQLVMSHLVKSGKLKLEDVREAEKELLKLEDKERPAMIGSLLFPEYGEHGCASEVGRSLVAIDCSLLVSRCRVDVLAAQE